MQYRIWNLNINELFIVSYFKNYWSLNACLTHAWFCNITSWFIWKILVHLNCADLKNIDVFHYSMFLRITFVNITTNLIRKVFKCWKAINIIRWWPQVFQLIFSWNLKFYYWQQILSIVFLEVSGLLGSFWNKCLPDP